MPGQLGGSAPFPALAGVDEGDLGLLPLTHRPVVSDS